jgi:hypothetical protein
LASFCSIVLRNEKYSRKNISYISKEVLKKSPAKKKKKALTIFFEQKQHKLRNLKNEKKNL